MSKVRSVWTRIQSTGVVVATPSTPTLFIVDDSGIVGDGITNVKLPHLVGTASVGITVQILNSSGTILGTAATASSGAYKVLLNAALADGTYVLQARAVDGSGNLSPLSAGFTLTIDTTPPAAPPAPTLLAADDSGTAGDGITNVVRPRIVGTAAPGATIQLDSSSGTVYGTATVAANGSCTRAQPARIFPERNVLARCDRRRRRGQRQHSQPGTHLS